MKPEEKNELAKMFDNATPEQRKNMIDFIAKQAHDQMMAPYAEMAKANRKKLYIIIAVIAVFLLIIISLFR
jgi:hypothetical protein